jgi:RNA polymerase sigma factor (sigma-70 family)
MKRGPSQTLAGDLDVLYQAGAIGGLTDRELLSCYANRDSTTAQQAFEIIVGRHGPMVLGVCRRVLQDEHVAEDAFQATFLVLATKARAIRNRNALGPWLHGVAARISRRAMILAYRRRERPLGPREMAPCTARGSEIELVELRSVLDEELDRLPAAYRRAIVLCYLQGKSQEDAARELGWTKGTVSGRLARAKDLLRARLTRRGFAPFMVPLASLFAPQSAEAVVPASLVSGAVRQATGVLLSRAETLAAPGAVVALARGALRAMQLSKLKLAALALVFLGFIAGSAGLLARSRAMTKQGPRPSPARVQSGLESRDEGAARSVAPDRIIVIGSVLAPDGKPISGAQVAVVARPQPQARDPGNQPDRNRVLGSARADVEGRFRVDFPRPTSDPDVLALVVGAPGWALGGKDLDPDVLSPDDKIILEPERVLRGRLIDLQGRPIRGSTVRVSWYNTLAYDAAGDAPPWPGPATTNEEGRFTLGGLGLGATVMLEAGSDRHARQTFRIDPRDSARTGETTLTLSLAQVIEARVTRAADGKPVPGASVSVLSLSRSNRPPPAQSREASARTNEHGLVQLNPSFGDSFWITASPPATEPYLSQRLNLNWPRGAPRQTVELKLKRGVSVSGTITEEASGMPLAGALVVYFQTWRNNPHFRGFEAAPGEVVTGQGGKFQMVVPAGPGHLLVQAPTHDYLHLTTNNLELGTGGLPNRLMYPDALAHLDLKPDEMSHEVTMRLRRGVTVFGRVIGPDGTPIARASALGRSYLPIMGMRSFLGAFNGIVSEIKVLGGRLEIPGCDPEKPYTFYLIDREHHLGATVELTGKSARKGPAVVPLQECGTARVRYVDSQGKPIAGHQPDNLVLVITPGTDWPERDRTMADTVYQVNLDPVRLRGSRTGADGRVTIVSLIPGATYRFRGQDFKSQPGKTIDLPDVSVPRP